MPRRSTPQPKPEPAVEKAAALSASIVRQEVPAFVRAVDEAKAAGTALTISLEEFAAMHAGDPARLADLLFMSLHYAAGENVTLVLAPRLPEASGIAPA